MRATAAGSEKKMSHLKMFLCMNFPMFKCSKNPGVLQDVGKHPLEINGSFLPSAPLPEGICHHFPTLELTEYAQKAAK